MNIKDIVAKTSCELFNAHNEFTKKGHTVKHPCSVNIIEILRMIRRVLFPGYFNVMPEQKLHDIWYQTVLAEIYQELTKEVVFVSPTSNAATVLIEKLAVIQQLLYKDALAGFEGDPAAQSVDDIILTYPGFYAIFVYRIAHILHSEKVRLIPKIMSEHAHSITGIEIHPGAEIGECFFIDHGTGVVIGETTVIGNNVKLYQGVTLGALSTKSGQKLSGKKRHPTIEDNVTIYSGATILGGETIIGKNSTIGGNVFITESVPMDSRVKGI